MSSSSICARRKHNAQTFILSCLRTVFGELPLHGRWLPAEQLRQCMHMKCNIGNDITFRLSTMMRVINKALPLVSAEPNIMEISDNLPMIQVYRYTFHNDVMSILRVGSSPCQSTSEKPHTIHPPVLSHRQQTVYCPTPVPVISKQSTNN